MNDTISDVPISNGRMNPVDERKTDGMRDPGKNRMMLRAGCLLLALWMSTVLSACGKEELPTDTEDVSARIVGSERGKKEETTETDAWDSPDFSDLLSGDADAANGQAAYLLALPEDSSERSDILAMQSLILCTGNTAEMTAALLGNAGFTVLTQKNFDKPEQAADHTCAFTVAEKTVPYRGEMRTLLLAAVRGTSGGEWYSNFDFLPSENGESTFSENFLFAAEDVFLTLQDYAENMDRPLFLLCGHSRGAACANLLGLLVNGMYGEENVFTYTFATPATLIGKADLPDDNIFNYVNPGDIVPCLPLEAWGASRAGTSIVLGAEKTENPWRSVLDRLYAIAPSCVDYKNVRHSLTEAGESEDGMTAYEVFLLIGQAFAGGLNADNGGTETENGSASVLSAISEDSDLYPLTDIFRELTENGFEKGKEMLAAHLPTAYAALIEERTIYGIH